VSPARLAVPPGRAGRLWLERRLEVARRGADLLDRKLRILQGDLDRLRASAGQTAREWERLCADAELWLVRGALLGGQRAIRLASDDRRLAEVTISYASTMGARHPAGAVSVLPERGGWEGPALSRARHAYGEALAAAVRHAVATAALQVIEAEAAATRHRLRAVRDRWIPRLEQALAEVTFAIEELERADAARLRLAAGTQSLASRAPASRAPASRAGRDAAQRRLSS
jgi:V/A-type H+-transporting ATPase subunit D